MQEKINAEEMLRMQGFSDDEINDMSHLTDYILRSFSLEPTPINWSRLAKMKADMLSLTGKTAKVREFSKKILESLNQFDKEPQD